MRKSFHSICRRIFNSGKGGFVPSDVRPEWLSEKFSTADLLNCYQKK